MVIVALVVVLVVIVDAVGVGVANPARESVRLNLILRPAARKTV